MEKNQLGKADREQRAQGLCRVRCHTREGLGRKSTFGQRPEGGGGASRYLEEEPSRQREEQVQRPWGAHVLMEEHGARAAGVE